MRWTWIVLLAGACATPDPVCEAGRQIDCACGDGSTGFQVCADDGSAWGTCTCDDAEETDDTDVTPPECPDLATCNDCLDCAFADDACATAWAACEGAVGCPDLVECLQACAWEDTACRNDCYGAAPGGEPQASEVWTCGTTVCADACP